ncbi:polyketide synthase [Mycobacterium sp. IS-1742]|uniref:type I polyketide synthase n=1 Tax=Mycobacterium sp. IS-1742 TaxID=1772285 RepID=UPI0007400690|nr:type I polyketide synthase [Mycobacterium sp. IS-1742]KUI31921.1 polyketide synthase [Mycobacterium sp. IS-1742]
MAAGSPDRRAIITEALRKIDDLTARLEIAERGQYEPIAVVGIGCRLPGGVGDPEEFWRLLCDGRSGIVEVPSKRWDADEFYSADTSVPGTICTREGGFLTGWEPDEFDAEFFGISPREAAAMDPQQRLLMEVAWEALEHAGITPDGIRGSQTSVFVGMTGYDYMLKLSDGLRREEYDAYVPFGNAANFAAGRLSYFLGLRGPAVVVDTACSSSLVSVHLACQSLRRRESDTALAAGVNLMLKAEANVALSRWGMLAPDGQCKTFDAGADGYVRSEGCGVVVLKRLGDALRDGDRVLALVRGSAVNQDGASSGQTVPNGPAQQALMRQALTASQLGPTDIDYIEAHGTGTALGDPIELDALSAVFGDRGDAAPLVLGSVKTNLGHLESGAGVTGFIKTVLSVQRGYIPKHLNFERLTPHAGPGASQFTIAADGMEWPAVTRARRAGVSSFGVSGTNAHIIVEQAPDVVAGEKVSDPAVCTLVVSGKSDDRIASTAGALAEWMTGAGVPLAEVAHTLNHHRARHARFATVCARDRAQAVAGLQALAAGRPADGVVRPHEGPCGSGTVFVFSGQGSQWAGMGRRLLADEPVFAAAVAELEPHFVEQVGFSLQQVLADGEAVSGDSRVQPVIMGLQLALTELWRSYGVTPDAVIGHSMGEVTAAVVAGALTPAEGLRVIAVRSRLMSRLAGQGAVALLELDAPAAEAVVGSHPHVDIAGFVSPTQTVVAGPPAAVDAVIEAVVGEGRFARRVNMEVASHTALMDPILDELRQTLADLTPQTPSVPFVSTVDDTISTPLLDANYWVANVRRPARLHQAVSAAAADGHTTFIEVSPHPILTHAIAETLGDGHHHAIGTLARDTDDTHTFHTNLNTTHTTRPPVTPHAPEPHLQLPTTPWHHTRHWFASEGPRRATHTVRHTTGQTAGDVIPAEWRCDLTWTAADLTAQDTTAHQWLVIGSADVATQLTRAGHTATTLAEHAVHDHHALTEALAGATRVVYAPATAPRCFDAAPARSLFDAARDLVNHLVTASTPAKLWILTRNAQPIEEGDRANPGHAVLWGLGRTLALEHPEIWGRVVDVDELVPAELVARYLLDEAAAGDEEDQVVYRAGVRRVPRLERRGNAVAAQASIDPDAAHLVVGATGNIGPHLVQQLADMGARTIVAVSRNPGNRLQHLTQALADRGVTLVTVAADASDETAMRPLFERFGADLPPLGGIYLAAFGGGPVTLLDMTDDDVTPMFTAKLDAAAVLHRLSLGHPVRQFVLFTSISGLIGSRWLAHYTATTTFLDTFAYARRAAGLPATAINWGFWKSLADNESDEYRQVTINSGLEPMPDEVAIQALWSTIGSDSPVRSTVVAADWTRLGAAYRTRAPMHILDDLTTPETDEGNAGDSWVGLDAVRGMEAAEARRVIADRVLSRLAGVLGYVEPSSINASAPLIDFGMDSLMAVRIRQATRADLGVEPAVSLLLQGGSLNDVTADVLSQLGVAEPGTTAVDNVREKANQRAAARRGAAVRRKKGQLL